MTIEKITLSVEPINIGPFTLGMVPLDLEIYAEADGSVCILRQAAGVRVYRIDQLREVCGRILSVCDAAEYPETG